MKNAIKFLALLFLITFVACDKDSALDEEEIQNQDLSGESLPEIYTGDDSHLKMELSEKDQMIVDFDEIAAQNNEIFEIDNSLSRARRIEGFKLDWNITSNTNGQGNTIHSRGNDRIYSIDITTSTKVKLTLSQLTQDLDLYLHKSYGPRHVGRLLARSARSGNSDEHIEIRLSPGKYYIVVDAYSRDGSFKLSSYNLDRGSGGSGCAALDQKCNDFESSRINRGITSQNRSWRKWSPSYVDGVVKYENSNYDNTVVKFDYRRFGRQDVVKSIDNRTLRCGFHRMNFRMYKAYGKKAKFASIKNSNFSNSNLGFLVDIDESGQMIFRQGNRTLKSDLKVPSNEWFYVFITFNLANDHIYLNVVSSRGRTYVKLKASAAAFNRYDSQKSIWGLNFYANDQTVKYHLDNMCTGGSGIQYFLLLRPVIETISFVD